MLKYRVISDSMTPLIPVGAEVCIRKLKEHEELRRFDIILFKQGNRLVCHYYWHENKVFDKGLVNTRCIKNKKEDHPFPKNQIIGVVTNFQISSWLKIKIMFRDLFR